jgi:non-ribosomal peptide synthetase component E (peptide arylation enzyme)
VEVPSTGKEPSRQHSNSRIMLADKEKATTERLLASIEYLRSAEEQSIREVQQEAEEKEAAGQKIHERSEGAEQAQREAVLEADKGQVVVVMLAGGTETAQTFAPREEINTAVFNSNETQNLQD